MGASTLKEEGKREGRSNAKLSDSGRKGSVVDPNLCVRGGRLSRNHAWTGGAWWQETGEERKVRTPPVVSGDLLTTNKTPPPSNVYAGGPCQGRRNTITPPGAGGKKERRKGTLVLELDLTRDDLDQS